jgi:uncharacterized protein involved in tolerance to divalent cations
LQSVAIRDILTLMIKWFKKIMKANKDRKLAVSEAMKAERVAWSTFDDSASMYSWMSDAELLSEASVIIQTEEYNSEIGNKVFYPVPQSVDAEVKKIVGTSNHKTRLDDEEKYLISYYIFFKTSNKNENLY